MKILITDDSSKMRAILKIFLSESLNEFIECSNGDEAVTTYQQVHPDIVLMDIEMGATNGITATKEIIALDPLAKIIIVTQHNSSGLMEHAWQAGACGYILKDNLSELDNIVQSFGK